MELNLFGFNSLLLVARKRKIFLIDTPTACFGVVH